jgi:hypothetical protein
MSFEPHARQSRHLLERIALFEQMIRPFRQAAASGMIKVLQNGALSGPRPQCDGGTAPPTRFPSVRLLCAAAAGPPTSRSATGPTLEPGSKRRGSSPGQPGRQTSHRAIGIAQGLPDLPAANLTSVIAPGARQGMMQHVTSAADENIEDDRRTDRPHPCCGRRRRGAKPWLFPCLGGAGSRATPRSSLCLASSRLLRVSPLCALTISGRARRSSFWCWAPSSRSRTTAATEQIWLSKHRQPTMRSS